MTTVLIVEDEPTPRKFIRQIIESQGYEVKEADSLAKAHAIIDHNGADIVLLDVMLPDGNGLLLLSRVAEEMPGMPVIVITGFGDIEMAVDAMQTGAQDFISKPLQAARLLKAVARADESVRLRRELHHLRQTRRKDYDWIQGNSPAMRKVTEMIERAAPTMATALLTGESGTGKEIVARTIHHLSPRRDKPFVAINCAAIPEHLLESELFGHEAHAFTGATKRKEGLMQVADGGTLFLDEVSGMKLDLQVKLLRVLEERFIRRVGGIRDIKIDIRLIAAANQDLPAMIAAGTFREDLYWRLKVVQIALPPLRERREDIPTFVGAFIAKFNRETGKLVKHVAPLAMEALKAHYWPGNVRELRNVIERAMLFCDGDTLELGHLPADIRVQIDSPLAA